jgi:Glyoxalase/Bleomycin resistance protein/Dioxygenase superfamily
MVSRAVRQCIVYRDAMSEGLGELYHTGLVVDDLDQAMNVLTSVAGLRWATPRVVSGTIRTSQGPLYRSSRFTYSVDGPHHVELIQHVDGTAWLTATGGRRVHHLGLWVDDLGAAMHSMQTRGLPAEFHGLDAQGRPCSPSFHRHPESGFWFELIDSAARPGLMNWWAAGMKEGDSDDG